MKSTRLTKARLASFCAPFATALVVVIIQAVADALGVGDDGIGPNIELMLMWLTVGIGVDLAYRLRRYVAFGGEISWHESGKTPLPSGGRSRIIGYFLIAAPVFFVTWLTLLSLL